MAVTHIRPADAETFSFDWGSMKWFVSPVTIPGAANSQGEVIINPGRGHVRHQHEHADELIYVISGTGTQTVGDEEFPIAEGDMVYIPMATMHSTMNTGWRTLRLIVTYTPGGEEQALTALPDFARHPAGDIVAWERPGSLFPPRYPGDHPCPAESAGIHSHDDEDQSVLQRATAGVRQERRGQAELH